MSTPDLNLLVTMNAVLAEGSVARAARRLQLSPSAMSRALARLRETTGDPLLVRAGRGLVPTPRALELREQVSRLVEDAASLLRPAKTPDLPRLARTFTIRTSEGFVENFGAALLKRISRDTPGVRLRFVPKLGDDSAALRDGTVDLETGIVSRTTTPELLGQSLFRDRFVGVVRRGHPLSKGRMNGSRYAAGAHIGVPRRGTDKSRIDRALDVLGLGREIVTSVGGFSTAVALARTSDLVATVPERHTGNLRGGMHTFPLPFAVPPLTVSMLWHPRMQADPAHRWLRSCVLEICAASDSSH
jgi:DNA-binding transcriptional LysR family regulator